MTFFIEIKGFLKMSTVRPKILILIRLDPDDKPCRVRPRGLG